MEAEAGQGAASELLDQLVVECVDGLQVGDEGVLERLVAEHPDHAERLRKRVELLARAGLVTLPRREAEQFPEQLGDFDLIRPLGAGGMGIVYLARQRTLDREVALKLVRPEQLFFPGARERFQREVATVARLQHPGIVPVYTVGEESGIPYFAMERVRGITLEEVIDQLRDRAPESLCAADALNLAGLGAESDSSEVDAGLPWVTFVLRLMRQTCTALAYAHEQGVLHRDLKPSNIMLTQDGRPLLVDFGLSSSEASERLTRTGSQLGSLPYMAPEQLRGSSAGNARSDVYQLGATLYELLALRLPFPEQDALELRQAILHGNPSSLRDRNPAVPPDVETVCRAALDIDPARRYASAVEFGEDLQRLLEHRPIRARRTGAWLRARRWPPRHPARTVALALSSLIVVAGPTLFALQQARTNRRISGINEQLEISLREEQAQRDEADRQRGLADAANVQLAAALAEAERQRDTARDESERAAANLASAFEAVDSMLNQVAERELRNIPQFTQVQRSLLERAEELYQELAQSNADDPQLLRARAGADRRLGWINSTLGDHADALAFYERQIEIDRELLAQAPLDIALRRRLAMGLGQLTEAANNLGDPERAQAAATEALRIVAAGLDLGFDDGAPEGLDLHRDLRNQGNLLGNSLFNRGRAQAALRAFEDAVALGRSVLEHTSADLNDRFFLAKPLNGLGAMHKELGQPALGLPYLDEGIGYLEDLRSTAVGTQKVLRYDLAIMHHNRAQTLIELGRLEDAEESFRKCIELDEGLMRENSDVPNYTLGAITARTSLCRLLIELQRYAEAEELLLESYDFVERVRASWPHLPEVGHAQSGVLGLLGRIAGERGDYEEAVSVLERAHELDVAALAVNPTQPDYLEYGRVHTESLARAFLELGEVESALAALEAWGAISGAGPAEQRRVAGLFARCSARAPEGRSAACRARAVELLEQVWQARGAEAEELRQASDLAVLAGDPGFEDLLERIAARHSSAK